MAQIFVGEKIDMDNFFASHGPDSQCCAQNIGRDPYAAVKFFHFIIHTLLRTMFGIEVLHGHIVGNMGALGRLSGYSGVIEAQGHGTLHVHMFIWLKNAPNADEIHSLLNKEAFHEQIKAYIEANIQAHLDAFDVKMVKSMPHESNLAYSRPLDPDLPDWKDQVHALEQCLIQSQQIHTCKHTTCLRVKNGTISCKR